MQYTYYCPSCSTPVTYGESNCRNCGVTLSWGTQQTTPQQQQQYPYSYENQGQYPAQSWDQQAQYNQQQAGWSQSQPYNQQGWGTGNQYPQQYPPQDSEDVGGTRFTPAVISLLVILALMIAGASVALAMNWTSISSSLRRQPAPAATPTPVAQPVAPPTITSFTASPASVSAGQPATLQWGTTNATDVSIDQGMGRVALSGVADVSPTAATTYKLTAANSSGSVTATTTVSMIAVALPVIDFFTTTPMSINSGDSTTLQWNVTGASTISVDRGVGAVSAAGKYVISPAASDNYTLTATNSAGSVTAKAYVTVALGKAPVITSFTATPTSIAAGQSAVLAWNITGATAVSLDQNFGPVGASGTLTVTPRTTTTYTISAAYGVTPVKASVTITVPQAGAPVITAFTSSPATIAAGQSSTLQWNVTGSTSVSIDHGIGAVTPSGTAPVSPTTHTTYTLTAASDNSSVTATTTVTVGASTTAVISSFTSNPPAINAGQQATLEWATTGANSVSIDQGVGSVPQSGTSTVSPASTTTYTLTAAGSTGSAAATVTVRVVPQGTPIITSFTSSPATINAGENATLQWNITGANSASIDHGVGVVLLSGTAGVGPPATTTYTLTARGNSGSDNATATVTVSSGASAPVITFTSNRATVSIGENATLQWNTTGADSASINHEIGPVPLSGTTGVGPTITTIYTLTATNGTIANTASVTITVSQ
jgi:hypothetical protein